MSEGLQVDLPALAVAVATVAALVVADLRQRAAARQRRRLAVVPVDSRPRRRAR